MISLKIRFFLNNLFYFKIDIKLERLFCTDFQHQPLPSGITLAENPLFLELAPEENIIIIVPKLGVTEKALFEPEYLNFFNFFQGVSYTFHRA